MSSTFDGHFRNKRKSLNLRQFLAIFEGRGQQAVDSGRRIQKYCLPPTACCQLFSAEKIQKSGLIHRGELGKMCGFIQGGIAF